MYWLPNYINPWEEIWQAMEVLVQQGKISYLGSSNFAGWQIAVAQSQASASHFLRLVSEQSLYNLTNRHIELEVIPACRHLGLGVLAWSPLARGLLGGILEKEVQSERTSASKTQVEGLRTQLEAYENLCREIGHEPSQVALAWLINNPIVTPVIGPRTIEQLNSNLGTLNVKLSDEVIAKLNEIWPAPSGEAPEAYAW